MPVKATAVNDTATRNGLLAGLAAYLIWGLMPLYLRLFAGMGAAEVLSHRIIWSVLALTLVVLATGAGPALKAVLANRRAVLLLLLSAIAIGVNWLIYTWAILAGDALDTSLGYFINPLINVLFGVALLGERLTKWQWVAVAMAAMGVAIQALAMGRLPLISLGVAVSFGLYGLLKKWANVPALPGLLVETLLLAPIAIVWLAGLDHGFASLPTNQMALLAASGVITAAPLLLFGIAARVLPLSTMGVLQYLSPTLVFLEAIWLFGETVSPARLASFACIWAGLALYTWTLRPVAPAPATR
jgi:chloramphenicol-sensitive protein RarD